VGKGVRGLEEEGGESVKVPVSILVPILNEEANLARCLKSVSWADEIFVVDSGSTDRSEEIAREHGAKVVQFKFNGSWPKKKNWALENLPFSHEWVFILDADEVLPPQAEEEFREISTAKKQGFDGYFINRRFFFMGKWLKHAYYPNWNLRLFKHRLGRYEKLVEGPTNSGDNEVHEHVLLEGKSGYLKTEMDHYAFPDVSTFIEKHNRYSNWEARAAIEKSLKQPVSLGSKEISQRRKFRSIARYLPFRPFLRFLYIYIIQKGFLDGREGYYFARLHALYEFLSLCKTYELKRKENQC